MAAGEVANEIDAHEGLKQSRDELNFRLRDETVVSPSAPFFITGSGRCGTTLLRRLVIEKSGAVIPPENYALGVSGRFVTQAQTDWAGCCQAILAEMSAKELAWAPFGLNAPHAVEQLSSIPEPHRSIPNFWHAFHALYALSVGKPSVNRWGDKTPLNVSRLDNIVELFPAARFIFMIRDVFDVAYSFGNMDIHERRGKYLDGAVRWVDANRKMLDFERRHPERVHFLRYEDLVRDPDQHLEAVLGFLDLPCAAAQEISAVEARDIQAIAHVRNALGDVTVGSIGRGAALPAEARREISELAAELQHHFGYAAE